MLTFLRIAVVSLVCSLAAPVQAGIRSLFLATLIGLIALPTMLRAGELHDAIRDGDAAAVAALLDGGTQVDETDYVLGTALHLAVSVGNLTIAKLLIDHDADVDVPSELNAASALHLAARFGDAGMVALLLNSGAEVDIRDGHKRTPLHRAAAKGHLNVVRMLLERGGDIGARDGKHEATPLHEAAHNGHLDLVKLLLDHGADIHATDQSGSTPLAWAAVPQSYSVVGGGELLEYLAANGADLNAKDNSGLSPLAYAEFQVRNGNVIFVEIVDVLRRLGANE